jgi:deazaflavin-dependent oxidoreductase (nitroreductase family)
VCLTFRDRLTVLDTEWPVGYQKHGTLTISTVGRKTGRKHDTTIWFAVSKDGRLLIATADKRRDWVRNAAKNPSVEITIAGVTRKMVVVPLDTEPDIQQINDLYATKYLLARLGRLFAPLTRKRFAHYGAFELKAE